MAPLFLPVVQLRKRTLVAVQGVRHRTSCEIESQISEPGSQYSLASIKQPSFHWGYPLCVLHQICPEIATIEIILNQSPTKINKATIKADLNHLSNRNEDISYREEVSFLHYPEEYNCHQSQVTSKNNPSSKYLF
jgi:hypothetical protein